jgi:hypothetical protein
MRTLRVIGIFIGMLLPGLSEAFMTYNQETNSAAFTDPSHNSTQKTPLPIAAEAILSDFNVRAVKGIGHQAAERP